MTDPRIETLRESVVWRAPRKQILEEVDALAAELERAHAVIEAARSVKSAPARIRLLNEALAAYDRQATETTT